MSGRAQTDTVEVGQERSGSRGHGGGGTQAVGVELTWWWRETSDWD